VLLPTLKVRDIVVMDNLTPHQNEETFALLWRPLASLSGSPARLLHETQPYRKDVDQGQTGFAFDGAKDLRKVTGANRHSCASSHSRLRQKLVQLPRLQFYSKCSEWLLL
jgi:hypothetical protein